MSSDGKGLAAGFSTYDGILLEPLTNADGTPRPVPIGTPWKPNYLTLFGTGLRNATNLAVRLGTQSLTPSYFGAHGTFEGLDQINIPLSSFVGGGLTDGGSGLAASMSHYLVERIERSRNVEVVTETQVAAVVGNGRVESVTLFESRQGAGGLQYVPLMKTGLGGEG